MSPMVCDAAAVTQNFRMTADGFKAYEKYADYPYRSFDITFAILFDNAADVYSTKSGFSVSDYAGSSQFDLHYTYRADQDLLIIGTQPVVDYNGTPGCNQIGGGLCFFVGNASSTLADTPGMTGYAFYSATVASAPDRLPASYIAPRFITKIEAEVPEPATWLMMIFGFSAVGW